MHILASWPELHAVRLNKNINRSVSVVWDSPVVWLLWGTGLTALLAAVPFYESPLLLYSSSGSLSNLVILLQCVSQSVCVCVLHMLK